MCLCCSKGGVADLTEWCVCGRTGVEEGSYWSAVKGWGSGRSWCSLLFSETIKRTVISPGRLKTFYFITLYAKYFRCSVLPLQWQLGDQCPPADMHFGMMPVHFPPSWKHVGGRWYTWDSILHTSDSVTVHGVRKTDRIVKRTFHQKKQPFQHCSAALYYIRLSLSSSSLLPTCLITADTLVGLHMII